MATFVITFEDGSTANASIDSAKLDELDILAPDDLTVTAQLHVKQLGKDYQILAGKFFTDIQNNLTTITPGSVLDAVQGTELLRLINYNKIASRILFKYDDLLTVDLADDVLSVIFPNGTIAIPDKLALSVSGTTVTEIPNDGGIKLIYNTSTNTITYSVVSDLSAYVEGSTPPVNTLEFIIARNIGGKLESCYPSLRAYIYGLA